MEEPKLLTIQEVSKFLNIHEMTLYKMAQQGRVPASKVGRVWRFRKNRIDAWLDKQENNRVRKYAVTKQRS